MTPTIPLVALGRFSSRNRSGRRASSRTVRLATILAVALLVESGFASASQTPLVRVSAADDGYQVGSGSVLLNHGSATYQIPLRVPPGTAGHTPSVSLRYATNSSHGLSEEVGLHWTIGGLSSIERNRRRGPAHDFANETWCDAGSTFGLRPCYRDDYVLDGQRLVLDSATGPGVHRTRIDDGRRIEFLGDTQGWRVLDREGRVLTYGNTADSRQLNYINGEVFEWLLKRSVDASGNWINYTYTYAWGRPLIYIIDYGAAGEAATRRVWFQYNSRLDVTADYSAGTSQANQRLLSLITVEAPVSQVVESYALFYVQSADSGRSLLDRVEVRGADGSPLPRAYEFEYTESTHTFSQPENYGSGDVVEYCGADVCERRIDLNGDGVLDLLSRNNAYLLSGSVGGGSYATWSVSGDYYQAPQSLLDLAGVQKGWMDLDGNGYADRIDSLCPWVVSSNGQGGSSSWPGAVPYLQSGKCWLEATSTNLGAPVDSVVGLLDMTGDGRPDRVSMNSPPFSAWKIQVNTGSGFLGQQEWGMLSNVVDPDPAGKPIESANPSASMDSEYMLLDVNSDGLPDRVFWSGSQLRVAWNYGAGLSATSTSDPAITPLGLDLPLRISANGGLDPDVLDINGDGFPDRVEDLGTSLSVHYGTGRGFSATAGAAWPDPVEVDAVRAVSAQAPHRVDFLDVNGDGLLDRVDHFGAVHLNAGPHADLLRKATDPSGGSIEFDYRASPQFRHDSGTPKNPNVPFPLLVVTRTTRTDGRGSPAIVDDYDYLLGTFLSPIREFLTFGKVVHRAMESEGGPVESEETLEFAQTNYCSGQLVKRTVTRADLSPILTESFSYHHNDPAPEQWGYCLPKEHLVRHQEGISTPNTAHRLTRTKYHYNPNPVADWYRLKVIEEFGDFDPRHTLDGSTYQDVGTDKRTIRLEYAMPIDPNSNYTVSKVNWVEVADQSGAVVARTRIGYDGAAAPSGPPDYQSSVSPGLVTTVDRRLLEGSGSWRWVGEVYGYDDFGNLDSRVSPGGAYDENGLQVAVTYDSVFDTFPTVITIGADAATPLPTVLSYTGCVGESPGRGVVFTKTSPHQEVTSYEYDAQGRMTVRRHASGLEELVEYDILGSQPGERSVLTTFRRQWAGDLQFRVFRDGMGREYRSESPGKANETVVMERTFDGRGRLFTESLPHFSGAAFPTRTWSWDELGRPSSLEDYDGTTESAWEYQPNVVHERAYLAPGAQTVLSMHQRLERDGRGRTTSIREYVVEPGGVEPTSYLSQIDYTALDGIAAVRDPAGSSPSVCQEFADPAACQTQLHETLVFYDTLGRRTRIEDPDSGVWTYGYYDSGLLEFQERGDVQDSSLSSLELTYDDLGRIQGQTPVPSGSGSLPATFVYGQVAGAGYGRLKDVMSAGGTTYSYGYDAAGRLNFERQTTAGLVFDNEYVYDELGRLKTRRFPDDREFVYSYDGLRLVMIDGPELKQPLHAASYDALGRPTELQLGYRHSVAGMPPSATLRYEYNGAGSRLSNLFAARHTPEAGFDVMDVDLVVDGLGRVRSEAGVVLDWSVGIPVATARNYEYDSFGRLVEAEGPWEGGSNSTWAFSYDPLGNLESLTSSGSYGRTWGYSNPVKPRFLTSFQEVGGPNPVADIVSARADGSVASRQRNGVPQTFAWNAQRRLHQIGTEPFSLHYDAFGRRTRQQITSPTATNVIYVGDDFEYDQTLDQANYYFFVDGRRIASFASFGHSYQARFLPWLLDRSRPLAAPLALTLAGAGLMGLLILASRRRPAWLAGTGVGFLGASLVLLPVPAWPVGGGGGSVYGGHGETDGVYYITDHLGSTRAVVSLYGIVLETRDYDPFGRSTRHAGDMKLKHRFTSQAVQETHWNDAQSPQPSALYDYKARLYDPKWGRFLTPDSRVEGLGSQGMNRYAYVGNMPTSRIDPTGMEGGCFDATTCAVLVGAAFVKTLFDISAGSDRGPSKRERLAQYVGQARQTALQIGLSTGEIDTAGSLGDAARVAGRIFEIARAVAERGETSVFRGSSLGRSFSTSTFPSDVFRPDDRVNGLNPEFASRLAKTLHDLRHRGYRPRVAEGRRTVEEQREKIAQGYSPVGTDNPNSPTASLHLSSEAADVIDRRWGYDTPGGLDDPYWEALGQEAVDEGLEWGGSWDSRDVSHVQTPWPP